MLSYPETPTEATCAFRCHSKNICLMTPQRSQKLYIRSQTPYQSYLLEFVAKILKLHSLNVLKRLLFGKQIDSPFHCLIRLFFIRFKFEFPMPKFFNVILYTLKINKY